MRRNRTNPLGSTDGELESPGDQTPTGQGRGKHRSQSFRGWRRRIEFIALTFAGTVIGVLLCAHGNVGIGPLRAELSLQPTLSGDTLIELGPLGQIGFDSHDGLIRVVLDIHSMNPGAATEFVSEDGIDHLAGSASRDLRAGFRVVAAYGAAGAALSAFLLVFIGFRRFKIAFVAAGCSFVVSAFAAGGAYLTFEPDAIKQPTYRGLVSAAPSLIGSAKDIAENFDAYRDQMGGLLANVTRLYETGEKLPSYGVQADAIRVLHVSDLHLNPQGWDMINRVIKDFGVDVVVDTGDISDHGTKIEDAYLETIAKLEVPYVYVRGNHDSDHTAAVIASYANATVLDNDVATVAGITFAGIGDPRFTPDKTTTASDVSVMATALQLAETVRSTGRTGDAVDIVLIHDPSPVSVFDGLSPLILSGHTHHRTTQLLPAGSRTMVQGSTGGSGLRALSSGDPDELQASLLHLSRDEQQLLAWDEITMSGLGLASVQISRRLP
jgi:predicted MPP superfamily phosphohydrolase